MFDSHAHYDDKRFDEDREEVLKSLFEGGVSGIVNIGCNMESSLSSAALSEKHKKVFATVGIHPHYAENVPLDYLYRFEDMLKSEKVLAVGEIGLDFYRDISPRDAQRKIFAEQLEFALGMNYPVVIHAREAIGECVETVLKYKGLYGVFHCFSGSAETAEILQKNGWYVSFSGSCTFDNARRLLDAVKVVKDEYLLVETDCPYLAPQPYRGKRNNSLLMKHTIEKIAEIRGVSAEYIEKITEENAKRFFRIPPKYMK